MRIVFSLVLILCNFTLSSQQSGFILIENKGPVVLTKDAPKSISQVEEICS